MDTKMIKKLVALISLIVVITLPLLGIDFVPGSGENVSKESLQSRERPFYYHNNTDDQHWYGTDKWAVRFDFSDVYPTYDTSGFLINKVQVYFPIIPVSAFPVTVGIYSEAGGLPFALLTSVTADISTNWMEFTLPQPQNLEVAWVVVNCNAVAGGPYMSASMGGGTHSYFWNTNTPTQFYQNMLTAGFASEFLISVIGRFELSGVDIELSSFDLKPTVENNRIVRPDIAIYNNSNVTVQNAAIKLEVISPNPGWAVQDTIFISTTIPPHSELYIGSDAPQMLEYSYQLPDFPGQLKIRAVLTTEHDVADTLFNNTQTSYKSDFNRSLPIKLVESFLLFNSAQNILNEQDAVTVENIKRVNYFPLISDTYYAQGAIQRFNWYGFTGYPVTVVGGDDRITGYITSTYPDVYNSALSRISTERTFLQQNSLDLSMASPYSQLQARLRLNNSEAYLFTGGTDPSLVMQSRFFAGLFKRENFYNSERLVFNRWGAYADTIATPLTMGQTWLKQFTVNVSDIDIDSLFTSYELVYWIQHNATKQIIYANSGPLNSTVSNDDELAPILAFQLTLAPNPAKLGADLQIFLAQQNKAEFIKYKIYNLKGQLVQQGKPQLKNGEPCINTQQIKTAGIYIIKLDILNAAKEPKTVSKKIVIY